MDKIFNILKPSGMTSFDVVRDVKKILSMKKVGHTGTLDPDAAGVLPICTGKATKVSELILNKNKTYLCEMTLGIETDTYDNSGSVLEVCRYDDIEEKDILKAFESMKGEISQIPPQYSALKVNGKRMCDLMRSGQADKVKPVSRKVNILDMEVVKIDLPEIMFRVTCSKGTYVRSICHDIGEMLGCKGHMSFLLREASGKFNLDSAVTLDELREAVEKNPENLPAFDIDYALDIFPRADISDSALKYYSNGGSIDRRRFKLEDCGNSDDLSNESLDGETKLYRVYNKNNFLGIGKVYATDNGPEIKSYKKFF